MNEVLGVAVLAYRNGSYGDAIDLLLSIVENERENWLAWFYLGMSYGKAGNTSNAHRIFHVICKSCPDDHLRFKAEAAIPALDAVVTPKKVGKKSRQRRSVVSAC